MKKISKKLSDTKTIAEDLVKKIDKHDNIQAYVLGLYGDLGAGKTALTQAIADTLGVNQKVTSPTFIIMNRYELSDSKFKNMFHIDAYRLEKAEELLNLGWQEIISDPRNLIIIEWPERVEKIMPTDHLQIKIKHLDESSREFDLGL